MGFLNHATNNIIIDAVLTERGRELLSRNDGSFNIEMFSFGDDEVDYSLISKYGLSIGKEKIEKNTPIFEANPNENIAIKHPLMSFTNPLLRLDQIPTLARNDSVDNSTISLFNTKSGTKDTSGEIVSFEVKNSLNASDITSLSDSVTDFSLYVKLHGDLMSMSNGTLVEKDLNGISTYEIKTKNMEASSRDWTNQRLAQITVSAIGVITAKDFTKYSTIGNVNKINTSIQILGAQSGASIVVPVTITRRTSSS